MSNQELLARARRVMPGGVLATFAPPDDVAFVVDRAEGCHLIDRAGNRYIDCVLGSGPLILGHRPPAVVEALSRQLGRGTQFFALNEAAIALAEELVAAIPCAELVKFTSSGAEATFQALRLARAFTGRQRILRFGGSYHGHHDYGMAGASAGIPGAVAESVVTAPINDLDAVAELVAAHDLAAVIVEPVHRSTPPRPGFLAGLRELTARHGIVLVFDEIVTGFRLAWGGAQERYGVVPDLATYGKVIGGGLPLAAVAGRSEIMALARPGGDVYFSGTLNGNPLAAAAGLATLRELRDPAVYRRLDAAGERLRSGLRALGGTVGGEGSMVGLAVEDVAVRRRVEAGLVRRGVFANLAAKLYLSTEHGDDEIDAIVEAVSGAMEEAGLHSATGPGGATLRPSAGSDGATEARTEV